MFLRYYYRMVTFYNISLSTAFSLLMLSVAEAARPNVVLINADDLGWAEVGCYGQKKIKTPNIDKLASEGQRWVYFYSGAPVCSPSRNVLMTGRKEGKYRRCFLIDLLFRINGPSVCFIAKANGRFFYFSFFSKSLISVSSWMSAGGAAGAFGSSFFFLLRAFIPFTKRKMASAMMMKSNVVWIKLP